MQIPMQRKGIFGQRPPMAQSPTMDHPNGMMNPVGTGEGLPTIPDRMPPQVPTFKQRLGGFLEGTVNDLMHMRGIQNTPLDQRRAMEQQDALMQRRSAQDWADWMRKADYERQNPKPAQPTEFERLLGTAGFSPEDQAGLLKDYVRNRANPTIPVQGMDAEGNKTMTFVPRGGTSQASQPHPDAIKMLLSGQGTDQQFDEAYGPGAAARVRGAGSGQPSFR